MQASEVLEKMCRVMGIRQPHVNVTSNSFQTLTTLDYINEAGQELARRVEWPGLTFNHNIPGSVSEYVLPDDFGRIAEKGAVRLNKASFAPVRPVVAPEMWAMLESEPSAQNYYHLLRKTIYFSPALDADGAIVRYVSENWLSSGKVVVGNEDELLLPGELVIMGATCRWLRKEGRSYEDAQGEYEAALVSEITAARGAPNA